MEFRGCDRSSATGLQRKDAVIISLCRIDFSIYLGLDHLHFVIEQFTKLFIADDSQHQGDSRE